LLRSKPSAALLAASIVFSSIFVGISAPASADIGDSNPDCNSGEICLDRAYPAGVHQRHFWDGGTDSGTWTVVRTGDRIGQKVHDDASSIRNRDTMCDVIEVDYNGSTVRASQTFRRGAASFVYIGASLNDKNDAHWRCRLGGV
jgi:hypothetical protein